ncbi:MAG: PcfJ domain-containing protein [Roseburia sp.]|nr:PcfJ domain-containing protein [Roseburia sp.]MCM1097810.1 PcfJ domain-containing protein [Ruminococcus flavefaciens]
MKRKAIEKIPYLTLPRVVRKGKPDYVAVTALREIGGEEHFLLEVYRNRKEGRKAPVVRIALTEKDFGNYFPGSGDWSREKIEGSIWSGDGPIWRKEDGRKSREELEKENVLYAKEDLGRIQTFAGGDVCSWRDRQWWDYLKGKQEEILTGERVKRAARKWEKRRQALAERMEQTEELPKQRILEYAERVVFGERHFLYYKKRGCWAEVACSKCGGVTEARWKEGISYESQLQRRIPNPREGERGVCPLCGAAGRYKCQGKARAVHEKSVFLWLGQKYGEQGMVFRYLQVEKFWQLEEYCEEKEVRMHGASEELSGIEIARVYFQPGEKTQTDYHKHNGWSGEDFWDDCNLSGLTSIQLCPGLVLPETYEAMEGTMFQYSALREYARAAGEVNPKAYLERYQEFPQLEMLAKLGLTEITEELVRHRYNDGIIADETAKSPDKFLGIRKERVGLLRREKGSRELLKVLKMEKRMGAAWTEEQIRCLMETGLQRGQLETALQWMGLQQLLNRVRKYAGCEYGAPCGRAMEAIHDTAGLYLDYLQMRQALGYDMTNTVYLQPRDLRVAHDRMAEEQNTVTDVERRDRRLQEVSQKYPGIRKNYRRLRKRFYYADEDFLIRPARSAEEIVAEGRILHHCVGGDSYLEKHDDGESYILMLRTKQEPEMPYITVEIRADSLQIVQWYGAYDRKPDEKRMEKWLKEYREGLERKERGAEERAEIRITA